MRLFLNSLVVAALLAWLYVKIATQRPSEAEAQKLKEAGYWLGNISPFLFRETQTKQDIYQDLRTRRRFFRVVLRELGKDAWKMLRRERVGFWSVWIHAAYWISWPILWLKSWVYCGYLDVFFVSGLSLTLYRSTQQNRV